MISTDDWVPGANNYPSFAKPTNGKYWLMVLEK